MYICIHIYIYIYYMVLYGHPPSPMNLPKHTVCIFVYIYISFYLTILCRWLLPILSPFIDDLHIFWYVLWIHKSPHLLTNMFLHLEQVISHFPNCSLNSCIPGRKQHHRHRWRHTSFSALGRHSHEEGTVSRLPRRDNPKWQYLNVCEISHINNLISGDFT